MHFRNTSIASLFWIAVVLLLYKNCWISSSKFSIQNDDLIKKNCETMSFFDIISKVHIFTIAIETDLKFQVESWFKITCNPYLLSCGGKPLCYNLPFI